MPPELVICTKKLLHSAYFSKLRELWDKYETLTPPPSCGCPESVKHAEHYQLQKLYKFLTGLNDSYENANDQILMTRPLPNINQTYAMIVNVESQRKNGNCGINTSVGIDGNDATALLSSRGNNNRNNTGGGNTSYKTRNNYNCRRPALQCDYCKLKGHTRDSCYKLHGYPADFKYRKKGGTPNTYANNVCSAGNQVSEAQGSSQQAASISTPPAPAQFFTSEQYNQILQMLNKGKEGKPMANAAQIGTAGIPTALMSNLVDHNWIELSSGKVIGIGREEDGLYILRTEVTQVHSWSLTTGMRPIIHLVFGSLSYATTVKKGDKFSPRAIPAVHLGYSTT
uniref:Uncharacterized protein n=1 Tax=Nicotiana tabacum TaxID=4097 RepID=A0A1S4CPR9_TOBAC|nr:PREDICTED: uncharacterized protein LOC107821335 [Nicotiana tabacum]